MKIKILVSCSGDMFSYVPGQVISAEPAVAKDLVVAGYAEEVKTPKANVAPVASVDHVPKGGGTDA